MIDEHISCHIDSLPGACALEFVAFASPLPDLGDARWPRAAGAVYYDTQQRPSLLHFAPARWLAPDPTAPIRALLAEAVRTAVGVVIDVTGKWDALLIHGPGATRLLACALEVESVLNARDCAAVTLFDCPATLARTRQGFAVWVQSSYTKDFLITAERFRAALDRTDSRTAST
ncbi:MAG TPA: hypothetical protein VGN77_00985 [Steroidobacteraceae bacterium]|nr:hypothetical protein [Steroidobacteraceae bacterium]